MVELSAKWTLFSPEAPAHKLSAGILAPNHAGSSASASPRAAWAGTMQPLARSEKMNRHWFEVTGTPPHSLYF